MASKTVTYNGKEISFYDATQQQRGIERKIRYWKRQEGALKAAGLDASGETAKVREWQARARDFTRQTGLRRQPERERIFRALVKNLYTPPLSEIKNLTKDKVLLIGSLQEDIVSRWTKETKNNLSIVLTGKQRVHYLRRHKEMFPYEEQLVDSVLHPDEIHQNKTDKMMAIFYKSYDPEHFLRVAVLMQEKPGDYKHSIISFRLAGIEEVEDGRKAGRLAWKK